MNCIWQIKIGRFDPSGKLSAMNFQDSIVSLTVLMHVECFGTISEDMKQCPPSPSIPPFIPRLLEVTIGFEMTAVEVIESATMVDIAVSLQSGILGRTTTVAVSDREGRATGEMYHNMYSIHDDIMILIINLTPIC